MQLTIDGRRMEIDSVDYENGHVSLRDLEMQGWFPIFRQETVPFVRDCVEQEWERAGFVTDVLETAEEKPQTQQAVILPCFHNFSFYNLADREIQQVHIHLDFKTVLVCHAVGNPYLARIADIHAVLVVFLQDKISDQLYGFLHFRIRRQPGQFFFRQFPVSRFLPRKLCLRFFSWKLT